MARAVLFWAVLAIALGSALAHAQFSVVGAAAQEPSASLGDVNCDGGWPNSVDATLILQFDAALLDSLPCQDVADPNEDGIINSVDAALILQFDARLICFPFADFCGKSPGPSSRATW